VPLADLTPPDSDDAVPAAVRLFVREADRRVEQFATIGHTPAFVACDYEAAYRALRGLAAASLARGGQFCEWGSGFGTVTCLAALLGFDAIGIEVERDLVEEARRLAGDYDLPAEFALGSFVPPGAEKRVYAGGEYAWFTTESDSAYDDLGLDPSDFDVVFAYPWPDEEAIVADLFDHYAGPGAVLVTCQGGTEFRFRRKVPRRKRSRG
jgi:hypothetical protein